MATVLLAIGDRSLNAGCLRQLEAAGHAPIVLRRPLEALTLVAKLRWDVVLVDRTPLGSETMQVLEGRGLPEAACVGIGFVALRLAASIPLPLVESRLLSTIDQLARAREKPEAPSAARELRLEPARRAVSAGGREVDLTRTEFRLLQLLVERQPAAVTLREVLQGVWGLSGDDSRVGLIRPQIRNLRRKLGRIGLAQALQSRRGLGYALLL